MGDTYIKVKKVEGETESEIVGCPAEDDGNVLVSTLASQFPGAIGLRYKDEEGISKALRVKDDVVTPPTGGWGDQVYTVVLKPSDPVPVKRDSSVAELDNVGQAAQKVKSNFPGKSAVAKRLFVGDVPFVANAAELLKEKFPKASNITVPSHPDTGKVKGYAYIDFENTDDSSQALTEMDGQEVGGRKIRLDFAPPGGGPSKKSARATRIWIGNLPLTLSGADELYQYFPGAIKINAPTHPDTGKIKGYAFAEFESIQIADSTIREKEGMEIGGRVIKLDFAPVGGGPKKPQPYGQQFKFGGGSTFNPQQYGVGGQQYAGAYGQPYSQPFAPPGQHQQPFQPPGAYPNLASGGSSY